MRSTRFAVLMLAALVVAPSAYGQDVRPESETVPVAMSPGTDGVSWLRAEQFEVAPAVRTSPFRTLGRDFGRFVGAENWRLLGAVGVAALASHSVDQTGVRESREHLAVGRFSPGNTGGSLLVQGGGALATWALGKATHSPRMTAVGGDLIEAQIVSQTVVQGLKFSVRRPRPDGSNSLSFPSGHTASSFATATVLQRHFGWRAGVPAYAFATYVGAARTSVDKHYLSDVVVGAGIGLVAGRSVTVGVRGQQFALGVAPAGRGAMVTFTRQ